MAEQNKIWSYSQTLSSFSYLWFCSPHIHMSTSYTLFIIFINPLSPFIVDHMCMVWWYPLLHEQPIGGQVPKNNFYSFNSSQLSMAHWLGVSLREFLLHLCCNLLPFIENNLFFFR